MKTSMRFLLLIIASFNTIISSAQDEKQIIGWLDTCSIKSSVPDFLANNEGAFVNNIEWSNLTIDNIKINNDLSKRNNIELDPLIEKIQSIKNHGLKIVRGDTITTYLKCVKTESITHYRVAILNLPLENYPTDSVVISINQQLKKGVKWNNLSQLNNTHDLDPEIEKKGDYRNDMGWTQSGEMDEEFEEKVLPLNVNECVLVKAPKYGLAYVVYKIEKTEILNSSSLRQSLF